MAKFVTAREAAQLIPDGVTVGVGGMGLVGWPEEIAVEMAANFQETGHPCNLTMKQGSAMGDWKERGMTRLGLEGLVTHWAAAHIGSAFAMNALVLQNKMHCHCLPQGVIVNLWREIAAGRPGIMTKVGLGTFVDPRNGGGKMNTVTTEDLVELVNFQGEEYLYYRSFPLNVALLRGTTADENGNITFEKDGFINEGLAIATAAHNSGGIVIVQVERVAKRGTLNAKAVKIPGILVDYVVVATKQESSWQTEGTYYEPAFSGELKKPLDRIPALPLDPRKVIARRCAAAIQAGNIVNLGVGMPTDVAAVFAEEGCSERITLSAEAGAVGGVPAGLPNFGSSYNPEAVIDHGSMFDFINGGGLDVTCLGLAQADAAGNINVSKFGSRLVGPGGFIDITRSAKKVIFCGTFMNKAKLQIADGGITVSQEGTIQKFMETVEQITFSGRYARPEQTILYVTERCVFQLLDGKMTLIEVAPGIDLERDILANMGFVPEISPDLKQMDSALFCETWGGLERALDR